MSVIRTTHSDCTIKKIDYLGATAVVHLKIAAFAKTQPEKGVMIGLKTSLEPFIPAFKVTSEDDVYQNKIFWINNSSVTGHTNQNIGMESEIQIPIDLSLGTYKNNRLYREVTIIIVDYKDESNTLWSSEPLHLCSGLLNFTINGDIIPEFNAYTNANGDEFYNLSVNYKFSENSWLFNLKHSDLTLSMAIKARQSTPFTTKTQLLPELSGRWELAASEIEPSAHVTIEAQLILKDSVLWSDKITCVPNEIATLYVKHNNKIHVITHKSTIRNSLIRDSHLYSAITGNAQLCFQIVPWLDTAGKQKLSSNNKYLYTLEASLKDSYGKVTSLKKLFNVPIELKAISTEHGNNLIIPDNLTGDIYEDFPTIIYNNYDISKAEDILSTMLADNGISFIIHVKGFENQKYLTLLTDDNIFAGDLVVREG